MIVVGVDPSLSCTGIAIADTRTGHVRTSRVQSEPLAPARPPTMHQLEARTTRIVWCAGRILNTVPERFDLVVVEHPSTARPYGLLEDRCALYMDVVRILQRRGPVMPVTAATRAKYATGSGNAKKKVVLDAVRASMPDLAIADHNVADAVSLALMGARWLGAPLDMVGKQQMEAFGNVPWPEKEQD